MAEKRMFTQKIIDSDAFLEMPLSAQALYFHLNMRADDDGFINNPKKIVRMVNASDDDLRILIVKRFAIAFESGVIVIKHWRMHNSLRNDRYHPTDYQEEFSKLGIKKNGSYTDNPDHAFIPSSSSGNQLATNCLPDGNQMEPDGCQDGNQMEPENRLEKNRLEKNREDKSIGRRFTPPKLEEVQAYVQERNSSVDAKRFWEYYNAGGWKDSKGNPVRNWKQKLLTWERKDGENGKGESVHRSSASATPSSRYGASQYRYDN